MLEKVPEFLKAHKEKKKGIKKDNTIYSAGYYSLGGIAAAFIFAKAWKELDIPGLDHKIDRSLLTGREIKHSNHITVDKTVALLIAVGLMMSELVGVKGGMASGGGFLLGYTAVCQLRKGKGMGEV